MNRFAQVKGILDTAVGGPDAPVGGPHGPFWRRLTRDEFVAFELFGQSLVTLGDGDGSGIAKALRGQAPFGQDTGTPGAQFRRMPAGRQPVPSDQIALIASWIDDGCPEEDQPPPVAVELALNGLPSGQGFVLVGSPAVLTIRTTDGGGGRVSVAAGERNGGHITVSPSVVQLSGDPVEITVEAGAASVAQNDTVLEIQGVATTTTFELTAIAEPALRFAGRFQCRLATDPDPFDSPFGEQSSFGVYAVQGPDPAHPDEPPLDRIVRFHDAAALRPFCGPIGVSIVAVEAVVGDTTVSFAGGDPSIGLPVRLGPNCKFDGRNRTFAPDGFEPIAEFRVEVGAVFEGASAAAEPRPSAEDPPGSTAPYADGLSLLDVDPTPFSTADVGYREATWEAHAWALVARKLAQLVQQKPHDKREARIRDRRIAEHAPDRLGAIGFPLRLMERYTGLVDRDIVIDEAATGVLAHLKSLGAIQFQAHFFDFDTDCQTGTVMGTLGAPTAKVEPPPTQLLARGPARRRAPSDLGG